MAVFSDAFFRLREDLDQAHEDRSKLIHDIRDHVRQAARQTADHLAQQGMSRRAEFAAMMAELRGKLQQQAGHTRGQLAELAADLRRSRAIFGRRRHSS